MVAHQVLRPADPTCHGGLWSPGDKTLLGRAVDAIYPFLWYAARTGDEKFRDAAVNVVDWTNRNLSLSDGSWKNGLHDDWQGITVFTATSIAEALQYHGNLLDSPIREAWFERLDRAGKWLYETIGIDYSNINYPIANAYAMAILGRLLDEGRYSARAHELAHDALGCFTRRDRLLAGEGGKPQAKSNKGCYPVDIAYNVEESLASLVLFGLLENDEVVLGQVVDSLRVHAEFMMTDGGWDNSWGTRNYKWTWWGSRTTMGCQPAYALLADRDPLFLEVAYRNMKLLSHCTRDGILYGGPHNIAHEDTPSLHHTTTHAKALATVLNRGIPCVTQVQTSLPCETGDKIQEFRDIATWLVSRGPWRATFTTYDCPFNKWGHPSGGALTVLSHRRAGLLAVASMTIFKLIERFDMQGESGPGFGTLTPRVELRRQANILREAWCWLRWRESATKIYMNILDNRAELEVSEHSWGVLARATSSLKDHMRSPPPTGDVKCIAEYHFTPDLLRVTVKVDGLAERENVTCIFPVVAKPTEPVQRTPTGSILIQKGGSVVRVKSSIGFHADSIDKRIFSYVPGVSCVPLSVDFSGKLELTMSVDEK